MGNVVINGLTAVHAGSQGTLNTVDVCKTPSKCRPNAFNNVAKSGDAARTASSVMVNGNPAQPHGLNVEGMKRRGFSAQTSQALRRAYRVIYRSGLSLEQALETLREMAGEHAEVGLLADFIAASVNRENVFFVDIPAGAHA